MTFRFVLRWRAFLIHWSRNMANLKSRTLFIKHLKPNLYKIGHSNQTISAVQASEQIAEYLEIKRGDAILRVRKYPILKTDYLLNMFVRSMQEVDLSFI